MGVLFLLAASALLLTPQDLPVIISYRTPSWGEKPAMHDVNVAIWTDGRIIWREPAPVESTKEGQWSYPSEGRYFEGRVPAGSMKNFLVNLDSLPAPKFKNWGKKAIDGPEEHIYVTRSQHKVHLSIWNRDYAAKSLSQPGDKQMWARYKTLDTLSRGLRPKVKKEIKRPDISGWVYDGNLRSLDG